MKKSSRSWPKTKKKEKKNKKNKEEGSKSWRNVAKHEITRPEGWTPRRDSRTPAKMQTVSRFPLCDLIADMIYWGQGPQKKLSRF